MVAIVMYSETCIKQTPCYGGWQQFAAPPTGYTLMNTILVSHKCPIIGKQVVVIIAYLLETVASHL